MKRITPEEAAEKMEEGYLYLDVRSIPEFENGHPKGAFNIPLMHAGKAGMSPNSRFMEEVTKAFPKDAKIVVGCQSGGRSVGACGLMEMEGYKDLFEQRAGFGGNGREPGWRSTGLPQSTTAEPGRSYLELKD
ncbi:MAG: rhodanese-like domain-containing protein [Vicinamibacteria bacterium]|nr:rhodanese-like domain-containing protein [Vicinamibacteria bacterium]